jgi:PIN domain nuclease of toxin-antitoxin system
LIVVDTHAVVWLTVDQARLSEAALEVITQGRLEGSLAIADVTRREIAVQVTRGRITVGSPLDVYLRFIASMYKVLPISWQVAERSVQFGAAFPRDPADRLIGATALVHGAVLVTKDELIRASGEVNCIW